MEKTDFEIEDATATYDTGKALKVEAPLFDSEFVWIPKSVITDDSEVWKEGQLPGSLIVKRWFAEKQGWAE